MFLNTEAGTFRPRVLDTTGQEIFVRFLRNFASDLPARFFLSLLLLFVFVHCLLLLPYFQILFSLLLCNCSCPSHFASSFLLACLNFQRPTFSAAITEHFASDIFLVWPDPALWTARWRGMWAAPWCTAPASPSLLPRSGWSKSAACSLAAFSKIFSNRFSIFFFCKENRLPIR